MWRRLEGGCVEEVRVGDVWRRLEGGCVEEVRVGGMCGGG